MNDSNVVSLSKTLDRTFLIICVLFHFGEKRNRQERTKRDQGLMMLQEYLLGYE